jgi:FkbM family methyltransferase
MVLLHGELYEEYVMQNIIPLLQMIIESDSKKNDVILLDIGANTDAWTIGLADKFDAPTLIYAFDPFREYLDCLEYSLQLNEFSSTNFVLMDMVISNENYHVIPIFKASENYRSSWTENTLLGFRPVFEQNNSNSIAVRS